MNRPLFCPACGAPLPEGPHGAQEFGRREPGELEDETGYDCHCDTCKWSGDILPDEEVT